MNETSTENKNEILTRYTYVFYHHQNDLNFSTALTGYREWITKILMMNVFVQMGYFRNLRSKWGIFGIFAQKGALSPKMGYFRNFSPNRGIFSQNWVISGFSPKMGCFQNFSLKQGFFAKMGYSRDFLPKGAFSPKWGIFEFFCLKRGIFAQNGVR